MEDLNPNGQSLQPSVRMFRIECYATMARGFAVTQDYGLSFESKRHNQHASTLFLSMLDTAREALERNQ